MKKDFWKFWDKRERFYARMSTTKRILACPSTAKYLIMVFISSDWIPSHSIKLFAFDDFVSLSIMQSSIHEVWARFQSGKLEQRLAYNLSKSFRTFPWPRSMPEDGPANDLWNLREQISRDENICFTDLYNALHDKGHDVATIQRLRELIVKNDYAVLAAYGWDDLTLGHDFHAASYLPENDRVRFHYFGKGADRGTTPSCST